MSQFKTGECHRHRSIALYFPKRRYEPFGRAWPEF